MTRQRVRERTAEGASSQRRLWIVLLVALIAAAGIRVFDIKPAVAQSSTLTAWQSNVDPGLDPEGTAWDQVPMSPIQLTAQNLTPPMADQGAPWVMAAALHHNDVLYVNLRWVDATADEATDAVGVFSDAVAIQFPAIAATSVPAICMGQADTAVNIWHWRADSQKGVATIPEHGYVDLYPEVDELHYPAASASNPMVTATAIQNLVAGGFGTLTPLESQVIDGAGAHSDAGWSVTMSRPFAAPGEFQPTFRVGESMDVAFAVWNGANDDRNGQKSVSAFVRMAIEERPYQPAGAGSADSSAGVAATVGWIIFVGVIGMIAAFGVSRRTDDEREGPAI
jgi:complex iron-sulfur molybdoenzyme family reductase subunit gamma